MHKRTFIFAALCVLCLNAVSSSAQEQFDPALFAAQAEFSLDDHRLTTQGVVAVLTDEFFSGKTQAFKILFVTEPVTEAGMLDALNNDGKELRKKDHVILVLFIDDKNVIWQVNMTYVIPGRTVVRTVAWKPQELEQFQIQYIKGHLTFRSKGSYREPASEKDAVSLTWDVGLEAAPVFRVY